MKKKLLQVYVGLGGNKGNPECTLQKALNYLENTEGVCDLETSAFYWTKPVSMIPQNWFLNAVCRFKTALSPFEVLTILQKIEKELGKEQKPQEAPRTIDLDLLFFDSISLQDPKLTIPHPRWQERLFVVKPLTDLTSTLTLSLAKGEIKNVDLRPLLHTLQNQKNECAFPAKIIYDREII